MLEGRVFSSLLSDVSIIIFKFSDSPPACEPCLKEIEEEKSDGEKARKSRIKTSKKVRERP